MSRELFKQEYTHSLKVCEKIVSGNLKIKSQTTQKSQSILQLEKNQSYSGEFIDKNAAQKAKQKYFEMMLSKNKNIKASIEKYQSRKLNKIVPPKLVKNLDFKLE